jgi:hypothetical protein
MFCGELATMKPKDEKDSSHSQISAQNSCSNTAELTIEIGRTLAQIGDKINTEYFKELNSQRDNIASNLVGDVARTLSVVLICGWCDSLR